MAKKYGTSSSLGGGASWLDKAGTYHARIISVDETPTTKDKMPIEGFRIMFGVLGGQCADGTAITTEVGKQFELTFSDPNPAKKESAQEWAVKKQTAFFLAAGLMNESQLGGDVEIELSNATNRQVIIQVEMSEPDQPGGKSFPNLAWANIYHIDDPRQARVPRDAGAVKLLPAAFRRDPNGFDLEKITGKASSASSSAGGSTNGQSRSMAGAGVGGGVDVDDV